MKTLAIGVPTHDPEKLWLYLLSQTSLNEMARFGCRILVCVVGQGHMGKQELAQTRKRLREYGIDFYGISLPLETPPRWCFLEQQAINLALRDWPDYFLMVDHDIQLIPGSAK